MDTTNPLTAYDFTNKTFAVTGGSGVLCAEMCRGLAACNANVVVLGRDREKAERVRQTLTCRSNRHQVIAVDVLDESAVERAATLVLDEYGRIDGLINGAGGNHPMATTGPTQTFFDLPPESLIYVNQLNLVGSILPSQSFGKHMARQKEGVILNVSSMSAMRAITRVAAYSAAKAAVSNFTQWLAVHLAQEYSANIRVNAIAPGFFLTDQNRFLLTEPETGVLTPRGQRIIDHTPMGRFGTPEDLVGATLWLLSPAARFVTGVVLPIDGGFSAFSGV
jgi:NAD(P)-dependent dehydrogenase (short-subunit alcohol dehydrogenase family)